jgi:hypothetical protein
MTEYDTTGQDNSGDRRTTEYRYRETLVGPNATADIPVTAINIQHERIGDRIGGGPRVRVSWLEPVNGGELL